MAVAAVEDQDLVEDARERECMDQEVSEVEAEEVPVAVSEDLAEVAPEAVEQDASGNPLMKKALSRAFFCY